MLSSFPSSQLLSTRPSVCHNDGTKTDKAERNNQSEHEKWGKKKGTQSSGKTSVQPAVISHRAIGHGVRGKRKKRAKRGPNMKWGELFLQALIGERRSDFQDKSGLHAPLSGSTKRLQSS